MAQFQLDNVLFSEGSKSYCLECAFENKVTENINNISEIDDLPDKYVLIYCDDCEDLIYDPVNQITSKGERLYKQKED